MSAKDLWIRDLITIYGSILIVTSVLIFWITKKWSKFCENLYRSYLLGFEMECAELAGSHKKRLFKNLRYTESKDEILKIMGKVRILEIGVKTGNNIQYYPDGTHLICVDWNRKLGDYLINGERSYEFSHITIERLMIGDGSSLKGIPSGCVDVVVTTRSLCSTRSVRSTLREIYRVLAPGGTYLFFEHTMENDKTFIRWLQKILTKTGIWPALFGGCRLDSNPIKDIEKTGFQEVAWNPITLQGYVSQGFHLTLTRRHVVGTAKR
ncbi:methyltransferase-like protein 7A [Cephus cinctus]|uniref:Methyltransferase-like protein 7A n=1 Tax=Cephus cinctus TaxID=211228 RepID=A0AAJ7C4G2_CEPCN|nr:methyltransferase-like protein 7A [Cephus cinctus]